MGRISYQVVPNGGWKYLQGNHWIHGHTWNDLIQTVRLHRQSNGIEIGNVDKDVEDQLCSLQPYLIINNRNLK